MLFQRRTAGETPVSQHFSRASRPRRPRKALFTVLAVLGLGLIAASYLYFFPTHRNQAQAAGGTRPALGVNMGTDPLLFTDAMKTARPAWDITGNGDCPLDANGWPTKDCGVYVWEGQANNNGTYSLIFNGQASVNVSLGYATVQDQQYDAGSNTTTAKLVVADAGAQNFHLNFENTKRDANSATGTGVTNVRLYKPVSQGSSTTFDPAQIFTPWYKEAVAPYDYLRFMAGTNWNKSEKWSDRTTVNFGTQRKYLQGESNFEGNLMAYEYMVDFANQTGKDLYLTVPNRADNDYVTKLAQLLLYGSDGLNPYTSPQANPVWKPLNSNQKVYVEYTNEAWNFQFDQTSDLYKIASDEVKNDPNSPLSYDGNKNDDVIRFRAYARRAKEVSSLFRQVFGDSAMLNRILPVLSWQYDNLNNTAEVELEFLNNYYNNADGIQHVSDPHPVSYFFWGGGGAVYYHSNNDDAGSVDGIFNSGIPSDDYEKMLQVQSLWAHLYGLRFSAYEGGFAVGGDGANGAQATSRTDPRAKQSMLDSYNIFTAVGGDAYTTGTYAQWIDPRQASSYPLVQAAAAITSSNSTSVAINRGQVLDGNGAKVIAGPHYDVSRTWTGGATSNVGNVAGYLLRADASGTYQVALNVSNTATGGLINVYLDGALLKTVSVPSGTETVVVGSASLSAGLHGLILRPSANASTGSAGKVNAVIIQSGTGTPPALATPGALPSGWQSQDIGSVGQAGSASYDNNTFTLLASGGDISNTTDEFRYIYQAVSGNGSLVARVAFQSNSDNYSKAGVMIREQLQGDAKHASTFLFGTGGAVLNDRVTTTGVSGQVGPVAGNAPYWVKIERSGSTFTSSISANGTTWKQIGTVTISMADTVYVGLAFSSHNNAVLGAADFDNVNVTGFSGAENPPLATATPTTPAPTATATTQPGETPTATATVGVTPEPTPTSTPTTGSGNWTKCADEGGVCTFSGTRQVRYGALGIYTTQTFTNEVYCNNDVFGDPLFGVVKQCEYEN